MGTDHTGMGLELDGVAVAGRLEPTTLALPGGELVGLVGPNGSGKSTLLQVAAGVLAGGGTVAWGGRELRTLSPLERGRCAAWVPQEAHFEFGFTVRSVVAQARYAHGDDAAGVEEALAQFELKELAERPVNRLSGGERQRVLLARAVATGARLQLWDEPLAPLDPRHALQVLAIAHGLARAGATVAMSLHDLRLARCFDRVVVMGGRRVVASGGAEAVLTEAVLREVFGVRVRRGEEWILELG